MGASARVHTALADDSEALLPQRLLAPPSPLQDSNTSPTFGWDMESFSSLACPQIYSGLHCDQSQSAAEANDLASGP
jgi:hypothetical protein